MQYDIKYTKLFSVDTGSTQSCSFCNDTESSTLLLLYTENTDEVYRLATEVD